MPLIDQEEAATSGLAPGQARRAAFDHLSRLLKIAPKPRWATPTLIVLGLGSSFAETVGITLIILFFYSAMGQLDAATVSDGILGQALQIVSGWFDTSAQMAVVILLLIIARGGLAFANNIINAYVSEQINEQARNLIHEQYLTVAYRFIQRHEQAQLMEVLGTESWLIANAYGSLTRIIISGCSILVFTTFLLVLSWPITLVALVGSLLISMGLRRLSEPARELGKRVKRVHQALGERMLMTLEGLRTIRAYGLEEAHQLRFKRSSAEARETSIALTRLSSLLSPLTEVGYLAILCLIIAGTSLWNASFPTILAAVALLYRLQPHAREMEGNLLYMAQIEPQLRSLYMMLRKDNKEYPAPGRLPIRTLCKSIRFDRVTFQHQPGSKPALKDVSFEIPVGVTTALVGPSGAGKTTIINLLLRLYQPSAGTIWVDDMRMQEVRRTDWLRLLAVAGQDVDLIEGTVIENIRMADIEATEADVIAASRISGVSEFIESLPDGYGTWIGQQGLRFSGGQRQRIGLARAFLRNPQVLILDEAMSALDPELEARIRCAMDAHFRGRTILIITHHPEAVLNADHVIQLDNGAREGGFQYRPRARLTA